MTRRNSCFLRTNVDCKGFTTDPFSALNVPRNGDPGMLGCKPVSLSSSAEEGKV